MTDKKINKEIGFNAVYTIQIQANNFLLRLVTNQKKYIATFNSFIS